MSAGYVIKNGADGKTLVIDAKGRARTFSVTKTALQAAVDDARSFNINTGVITLSAIDGEQAVFYLTNTNGTTLEIENIILGLQNLDLTAASTDSAILTLYQNPVSGTIIDDASAVKVRNRKVGSTDNFATTITAYKATGGSKTLVPAASDTFPPIFFANQIRNVTPIDVAIPSGQSIGLTIDLKGGSGNCYIAISGFVSRAEDEL